MTKQDQIANILTEYTLAIDRVYEQQMTDQFNPVPPVSEAAYIEKYVKIRMDALIKAQQKLTALLEGPAC